MENVPYSTKSYWIDTTPGSTYSSLQEDIETDVVIVGAGIAGLTTAYMLKKAGKKVVVLEKDTVGSGVSGHTTGKVTSQHNLIYNKLSSRRSKKAASVYGQLNQDAIEQIENIIQNENIDCGWTRLDNYVFTTDKEKVKSFHQEALAATSLGLPASFEKESPLPFPIQGAVRFKNQATFHTRKYLQGLAKAVHGHGCYVLEKSSVTSIKDGSPATVAALNHSVTAKDIIVTTNIPTFPLMARVTYALLVYPMQSYIVAGEIDDTKLNGMYISPDNSHYSILPFNDKGKNLVLIGGEGHLFGTRFNYKKRYSRLFEYGKEHFHMRDDTYRWTHRDYLGYDDMPGVGLLYPWSKHVYTATGFMKWGLTNGTVAARLLTDMLCANHNEDAKFFDPHRLSFVRSIPFAVKDRFH